MRKNSSRHVYYESFNRNSERCEIFADYIIENKCTVRKAAAFFGISKSTVHKDVTKRLRNVNPGKYTEVQEIIRINKSERHLRGGLATKKKYQNIKNNSTVPIV